MNKRLKIKREMVPVVQAYASTFGTPDGLKVLEDMEKAFGGSCYSKGDPYDTTFREGQRDVLDRIKELISYSGLEVEEEDEAPENWDKYTEF
jgi:hypothetical protein